MLEATSKTVSFDMVASGNTHTDTINVIIYIVIQSQVNVNVRREIMDGKGVGYRGMSIGVCVRRYQQ